MSNSFSAIKIETLAPKSENYNMVLIFFLYHFLFTVAIFVYIQCDEHA